MRSPEIPLPPPAGGWPDWVSGARWVASRHPADGGPPGVVDGANCQRYAGAVLALFGRSLPALRSAELAAALPHIDDPEALDLVLVGGRPDGWGAHVGIVLADERVLHLCAEVGRPAVWAVSDFAARPRYAGRWTYLRVPEECS